MKFAEDKSQTVREFDEKLDKTGTSPKMKTPEEMKQNPLDLIEPDHQKDRKQRSLDDTWWVAQNGEPHHGHDNTINQTEEGMNSPGSGANEGRGSHKWGINDNGASKGPPR